MAAKYDLYIDKGETFRKRFMWRINGVPAVDMTGWAAKMQIREEAGSEVLASFSHDEGDELVIDGPMAAIDLLIHAAESLSWTWESARYDLIVWDPSPGAENSKRVVQGSVFVDPGITVR